jgi:hypothetical protein
MAVDTIPSLINGKTLTQHLLIIQECLATKGTGYLNKILGGVRCSNLELSKLELIFHLLSQSNTTSGRGLECIFTLEEGAGFKYGATTSTPTPATTHLETFITFASQFCKDCIVTEDPTPAVPPATTYYLMSESGVELTLENGGHINLQ